MMLRPGRVRLYYSVPPGWGFVPESYSLNYEDGTVKLGLTIQALDLRASMPIRLYDIRMPLQPPVPARNINFPDTWYQEDLSLTRFTLSEFTAHLVPEQAVAADAVPLITEPVTPSNSPITAQKFFVDAQNSPVKELQPTVPVSSSQQQSSSIQTSAVEYNFNTPMDDEGTVRFRA